MRTPIAIGLVLLSLSCKESPTSHILEPAITLTYTHQDSVEARQLALWFGARLTPPDSLVSYFLHSINYLRFLYHDSTHLFADTLMHSRFLLPWDPHIIGVKFDSLTSDSIRSHTYSRWTVFPAVAQPDSMYPIINLDIICFVFREERNPWRLVDLYRTLPGAKWADANVVTFIYGTFPMFPGMHNGEMSYMFVSGAPFWNGPHHYFYYRQGTPLYGGSWWYTMDPKPNWFDDARLSVDSIYTWGRFDY